MSYFYAVPSREQMREEALNSAEEYFIEMDNPPSSLSLRTIVLPEPKPLKDFPRKVECCFYCRDFGEVCTQVPNACYSVRTFSDCVTFLFKFFSMLLCAPLLWVCNIFAFFDDTFMGSLTSRRDLFTVVFIIYEDGIYVYHRAIKPVKCKHLCFSCREEDFGAYESSSYFLGWNTTTVTELIIPFTDFPQKGKWAQFSLGYNRFRHRRDALEILKQAKEQFEAKNIV
eukprot:snap_masked-scaffold_3-processed-gene-10.14-mRNA-1 protein AED:1.00 eAED:1.00 QI:0/-1/0/0/-1/1/1/0/226